MALFEVGVLGVNGLGKNRREYNRAEARRDGRHFSRLGFLRRKRQISRAFLRRRRATSKKSCTTCRDVVQLLDSGTE